MIAADPLTFRDLYLPTNRVELRKARRRLVVNMVLLIYALALIEGPLRKWILPELATPIYFTRDPVLLFLYCYCLKYRLFARGTLVRLWFAIALVTTVVGILPFIYSSLDPRAWILGVRSYWIYMPLAFVIAVNFHRQDVERFFRWNMLLAGPYAALVILQYRSSPSDWINRGLEDEVEVAMVAFDIVRPYGLFTFTGPHVDFTASIVAMFVAFVLSRRQGRFDAPILCLGAVAVGAMAVLTGSRGIYFSIGAICIIALVGSAIANPSVRTLARTAVIALAIMAAAVLYVTFFADMYTAMETRFEVAARAEGSIWERALAGVFGFIEPMFSAPLIGYGIGTGTPPIASILRLPQYVYGENELVRVVNELGFLLGLGFIFVRLGTAFWLVAAAFAAARRGELAALPLSGYTIIAISIGQITFSPLNAFQPWVVVGVILALCWDHAGRALFLRTGR
ncbi:hypothetical protein [Microvirga massiliensis]|uniref:hypothetical protein n=1 Tax=Microvirga massiliensis TaxID=1033741 RepID=UPI00062B8AE6|nr:hypothetical protein [Microvirga massiliensis]